MDVDGSHTELQRDKCSRPRSSRAGTRLFHDVVNDKATGAQNSGSPVGQISLALADDAAATCSTTTTQRWTCAGGEEGTTSGDAVRYGLRDHDWAMRSRGHCAVAGNGVHRPVLVPTAANELPADPQRPYEAAT